MRRITIFNKFRFCIGYGLALLMLLPAASCSFLRRPVDGLKIDGFNRTAGRINIDRNAHADSAGTNSVGIEIFIIHVEPHQDLLLQQLWQEIDEQALPPLLRRELMMQGFRAGILGSIGSPALTKFLQNSADFNAEEVQKMNSHEREIHAADILRKTAATRQYRTLVPDMRALVRIFDNPLPDVFLFWNEDSLYCGQTYRDATGILCVQAKADKDGGAAFDIVPELEYGKLEQRIRHHQGMIIQETSRPRKTFPALTVSQRLLQGQWILIGAVSREYTGLGNTFFVRAGAEQEQRLFAVRFVQAAPAETQGQSSTYSPHVIPERN